MKSADSTAVLELQEIVKRYGNLTAVDGVSLSVAAGEKVVVIGPSGSGKSTLLRSVNMLECIDGGHILFEGRDVGYVTRKGKRVPDAQKNICRLRSEIGMVFQHFHLFPHMTVLGNVMEGPVTVKKMDRAEACELACMMLEKVGLSDKKDVFPATLSGGQKQRVAIARALAMQPKMMLFDEPTSALDPELVGEVFDTIRALAKDGMTMIIVTHQMGFAREIADRVLFMENGVLVDSGKPADFFGSCQENDRISSFLSRCM
ncbi:amino acid ABC transporter ATP-binding protein [Desulfobotulus sp. H1]|uniref:Amino acid ABC transporter ATP-binding protein n=1 Tax=Desulfobotulus pelophilus TaxID=2823377 RepID=A0ABT3N5X0_9BACT|nr:amino acid ABC transporter ATP-binding protein [Desulfobotulus pelophilus]MCW7752861.1 amino acid ABC transporter ATP-binding protein [Desulfobotulus pelophilus]